MVGESSPEMTAESGMGTGAPCWHHAHPLKLTHRQSLNDAQLEILTPRVEAC